MSANREATNARPKTGFLKGAILSLVDPRYAKDKAAEQRRHKAREILETGIRDLYELYKDNLEQVRKCNRNVQEAMNQRVWLNQTNDSGASSFSSINKMEQLELDSRMMEAIRNKRNAEKVYRKTGTQLRVLQRDLELLNDKETNNKIVAVLKTVSKAMDTTLNDKELDYTEDTLDDATENRADFYDSLQQVNELMEGGADPLRGDEENELVHEFEEMMRLCDEQSRVSRSSTLAEKTSASRPQPEPDNRHRDAFESLRLPIPPTAEAVFPPSDRGGSDDDEPGGNQVPMLA